MSRRLSLILAWTALLATAVTGGCATLRVPWSNNGAQPSTPPTEEQIKLSYRTNSDRLNVSAGLLPGAIQPAAYAPGRFGPFPAVSNVTVSLSYPHPQVRPGMALAVVTCRPQTEEQTSVGLSFWQRLGGGADAATTAPPPAEVWALEIPKAELDAILAKLRKDNFFQRSRVLGTQAHLGTEINGVRFSKDYQAVSELDALILRVRGIGVMGAPRSETARS